MKKLALLAAVLLATNAFAADKPAAKAEAKPAAKAEAKPEVATLGEVTKITATVEAIDQKTREVTLKGPKGNTITFTAGPEVKNLAQVKKGDEVTVEYGQALAVSLKKSTKTVVSREITEATKAAAPGKKPGVVAARKVAVTAQIQAIDTATNMVTLKGVEHTVDIQAKDPAVLKEFKVGDFVDAVYVEAVAISVHTPKAAPAKK
jgi:Cu/Ag efflux protein CusF